MDQTTLISVLIAFGSLLAGAVLGGGTVIIIYGRTVHSILNSPVILGSLEKLAASWPAPVRDDVAVTGQLLQTVAGDTTTTTTTTATVPNALAASTGATS